MLSELKDSATTNLLTASAVLDAFRGHSFAATLARLEAHFIGVNHGSVHATLLAESLGGHLLQAAFLIKRSASQIDEIVHALGILLSIPQLLEAGEIIESLSLGAGNTGRGFDLETNSRIAEFTFIRWQGGPEVIRQNKVFKDFYFLAEEDTPKRRELFVIGTEHVLKFLNSRRSLPQILAGNAKLGKSFRNKYGEQFKVVSDYYSAQKNKVVIRDIQPFLPKLD